MGRDRHGKQQLPGAVVVPQDPDGGRGGVAQAHGGAEPRHGGGVVALCNGGGHSTLSQHDSRQHVRQVKNETCACKPAVRCGATFSMARASQHEEDWI